jgi:MinD superfamily P-loop ATPase
MVELHLKAPTNRVPLVQDDRCAGCRRCVARGVCRTKAIVQLDPGEPPMIDASRCYGCLVCITECPRGAISLPE